MLLVLWKPAWRGLFRSVAAARPEPSSGSFSSCVMAARRSLSGEIYAMMDDGEVLLMAGDVLVQRGTNHAWSNRTNETAVVAFVLIDAEPV